MLTQILKYIKKCVLKEPSYYDNVNKNMIRGSRHDKDTTACSHNLLSVNNSKNR